MNSELLRGVMEKRGVSQKELAVYIGIRLSTLKKKIRGESEFTLSEINKVSEILFLKSREIMLIFFT